MDRLTRLAASIAQECAVPEKMTPLGRGVLVFNKRLNGEKIAPRPAAAGVNEIAELKRGKAQ